jgi:hypothetical protein
MRQASTPAPRRGAFSFACHARVAGLSSFLAGIATLLGLIWSCTLLAADVKTMIEIRYEEKEIEQPVYLNRILIFGERLRMDYGQDDEDFILYDRRENIAWHVAREGRRLVGINASPVKYSWPKTWKLAQEQFASGANKLTRVQVNEQLCVEFKTAPILKEEARLLRDFRRALAGNQSSTWSATPEELRHPCNLVIDVREAGIEYRQGLPLAIRYWDGRSRVYQNHVVREAKPELFDLPGGYSRFMIGERQEKANARQPAPSQRK